MKLMNKIIVGILFLFANHLASAQYKVVKNVSVNFKIKNAGIGVDGKFSTVSAVVFLDETNPAKCSFNGMIETKSVSTGIKLRDTHIKEKEEFFNVEKFPTMTMKSVSVVLKNAGIYTVTWNLTIKGITRRFSSEVKTTAQNGLVMIATEFKINRNEWKIGGNSLTMSDNVTIKLNSTLSK